MPVCKSFGRSAVALSLLAASLTVGGCGPKKFDAASLADPANARANAGSFWSKDGWWKLPADGGKKIAITEFTVQIVTDRNSNISQNQLGLLMVAEAVGAGKRQYEFDESFKKSLPTDLYNAYVQQLEAAGFSVVPMSAVASSKAMSEVDAGEEGAKKTMGSSKQKGEIYSVEGLSRMYAGFMGFGEAKHAMMQANVMAEVGADIGMRVHMIVGLHEGQATVDEGSQVLVYAGLKNWAGPNKEPNYGNEVTGSVTAKQTLYRAEPVIDEKEFEAGKGNVYKVNSTEYKTALMEIYVPYAVMAVEKIKN